MCRMSGVCGPFFVSSLLNLWTNYRHYWLKNRLPVYLRLFFSFTLSRGPGMSLCTPAVEKEMKAKNVADVSPCSALGLWALDASQVVEEGVLRCPLKVGERGR